MSPKISQISSVSFFASVSPAAISSSLFLPPNIPRIFLAIPAFVVRMGNGGERMRGQNEMVLPLRPMSLSQNTGLICQRRPSEGGEKGGLLFFVWLPGNRE